MYLENTIVSEGFKGGTRGAPIMPRDAVSRTANVERNGGNKWVLVFRCHTEKKNFPLQSNTTRHSTCPAEKKN